MLASVNSSPSFGKTRQEKLQKSANNKAKFGAQAGVVLGYAAGAKAINTIARGKSFVWNTAINKTLKNFVANTGEFFGSGFIKDIATKISKTSGRQKLLGAATLLAIGAFVKVSEHFAKKNGQLNAGLK